MSENVIIYDVIINGLFYCSRYINEILRRQTFRIMHWIRSHKRKDLKSSSISEMLLDFFKDVFNSFDSWYRVGSKFTLNWNINRLLEIRNRVYYIHNVMFIEMAWKLQLNIILRIKSEYHKLSKTIGRYIVRLFRFEVFIFEKRLVNTQIVSCIVQLSLVLETISCARICFCQLAR